MTSGNNKKKVVWVRGILPIFETAIKTNTYLISCKQPDHFFGNLNQLAPSPCFGLHPNAKGG